MTDIYISRHGITESNKKRTYMGRSNESLAPEGVIQAESLGNILRPLGIKRIYTSPIQRAVETSKIVSRILNVPVTVEEDLTEMKLDAWAGLSEEEVARRYPEIYHLWNTRPGALVLPGRETLREVQSRAVRAIFRIKQVNDKSPILVITHVAIIRCLIIYFQNLDINIYRTINVPNISIYHLELNENSASITEF